MRAGRLRDGDEGLAPLAPLPFRPRALGPRPRCLHRPGARACAQRGPGVFRLARPARLPDAGQEGRLMAASLLVELLTEELPPKALSALGLAFANGIRD